MLQQNIDLICRNRTDDIIDEPFPKNRDTGAEDKALCWTSSITKLAITAETGDPIAVPKTC
jgi:hypothetical protein